MNTYTCTNCGKEYQKRAGRPVRYTYCDRKKCQEAKNKKVYEDKCIAAGRPLPSESKKKKCLNCGKEVIVGKYQTKMKYVYCKSKKCQDAKRQAFDKREKKLQKKYRKTRSSQEYQRTFKDNLKSRLKDAPKFTGKNCPDCGDPVQIEYPSAGHAGIWNIRCRACRDKINNTVSRLDDDYIYWSY